MKKLFFLVLTCAVAITAYAGNDQLEDSDHPAMYLAGEFSAWARNETARFARQGDEYTIHMASLDGKFKITGSEWEYNFGAPADADPTVSASAFLEGTPNGPNFNAQNLEDVEISFSLNLSQGFGPTRIKVKVGGEEPVIPPVQGLSGTLPVLYINVYADESLSRLENEIIDPNLDHKNYFEYANYWLDLNGCEWMAAEGAKSIGSAEEPLPLQIKARGNWTRRGFAKKPFKLKLGSKQKLLGLSKSKHFALLAHADDYYGYLRNFTGFNLGRRIGLPWTPAQQPVEVVINGDYRGLYFLTESIRVESGRIEIQELDDLATDPEIASGGYLVELDNYDEDNQIRMPEESFVSGQSLDALRITWDTPEEYSPIQEQFITDQFTIMNHAIGTNDNNIWAYIDLDDAARYYLVTEILSHVEAYHGSTYLFRDRGEGQKWHFSPLWDMGNAFVGPTDGFFYDHDPYGNTWIPSMRCNAAFNQKVSDTWKWFMSNRFDGLFDDIDTYVSHISAAAVADRLRWKDAPVPWGGVDVSDNSNMEARRQAVVNHLNAKINWLKSQFGDYTAGTYTEPERDNTPAAPLPGDLSGIENVSANSPTPEPHYYNLQGLRVLNPAKGYYIERTNTGARVVYLR